MPIFQRSFYSPEQTFTNLFRLLDDFDNYSREVNAQQQAADGKAVQTPAVTAAAGQPVQSAHAGRHHRHGGAAAGTRLFNPRFDVRETDATYELHGELPGVDKKDLSIEFTEPQTLVVSGSVERNYTASSASDDEDTAMSGAIGAPEAAAAETAATEGIATPNSTRSQSPSRHATVTDEATEDALEKGEPAAEEPAAAAATAVAKKEPAAVTAAAARPAERYWYQERSVGQFHRTFAFPAPVDEAHVKASLENGILNISIPKAVKHETRRIAVY